jgi:hypothetical protein
MDRKSFLKKALLGLSAVGAGGLLANRESASENRLPEQVGFEHIPPQNDQSTKTMKTILHKASSRGSANYGWLNTHHSFSFANWYNPERMNFGALRVLNDDIIQGGTGFGTHPHDNMEIISIPLSGALEHRDSMGNVAVIRQHEVQIMSAGTGIQHSEHNKNRDQEAKFLQIWVFPRKRNITPRYEQQAYLPDDRKNMLQTVVSPTEGDGAVTINQDAWFSLGNLESGFTQTYKLHQEGQGVYAFVLRGEVEVAGQALSNRDGLGIWDTDQFEVKATTDAELLLIEVPMTI